MTDVRHFPAGDPIGSMTREQAGATLAAKHQAFLAGERPGYGMANPETPVQARNRLDQLTADPKWSGALLSNDTVVVAHFKALADLAASGGPIEHALTGTVPFGHVHTEAGADLRTMSDFVADARRDNWDDIAIVEALTGIDSRTKQPFTAEDVRQAKNKRAALFSDVEFRKRYQAGDRAALRQSQYLSVIIGSEQTDL